MYDNMLLLFNNRSADTMKRPKRQSGIALFKSLPDFYVNVIARRLYDSEHWCVDSFFEVIHRTEARHGYLKVETRNMFVSGLSLDVHDALRWGCRDNVTTRSIFGGTFIYRSIYLDTLEP